ncbi:SDR family oxidoreductase [Erythrobacter dokdonensis]|uniref:Short-chain dehydrogenase/reductase SDR n=1 Tax=Erythrobacter dokdonensis DSW-74 TaxID=1300349 RepID=A0A1A7BEK1_9SPHN|nr:SDR family NAD(P)-dependent oxidoreductase [Erythrobacter dokdonensis]OBV10963.1 Short-chain dehydrogenase/reductase SDR [Erythrobacter dokdonensis DSW-74]
MIRPLAIIAGAGPGIGGAVARAFSAEGFAVALLARRLEALEALAEGLPDASCWPVDLADPSAVAAVIRAVIAEHGSPSVLHYNAAAWYEADPLEIDPALFTADLSLCATGALAAVQAAVPAMKASGGGTLLFTGGGLALRPEYGGDVISLTAGKAAMRAMVLALAPKLAPMGGHAATVTVAGTVAPGTAFDPDIIAEAFLALHKQAREDWQAEVVFDGRR